MRGLAVSCFALFSIGLTPPAAVATILPGAPQPPRPGSVPVAWVVLLNDALGGEIGDNPDDFRTQTFYGARRWRRLVVAFDYSILTHKNPADRGRVDELTLTLGRYWIEPDPNRRGWLAAGLGGRLTGDLAGDSIQNGWHDIIDVDRVDLPYEAGDELAAVGYVYGGVRPNDRRIGWFPRLAPFVSRSRFGPDLEGGLLVTSGGEIQGQLTTRLTWTGADGAAWLGLRQEIRAGDTPNPTTEAVAQREEGAWLVYGGSFGAIFFEGGLHLENDASVGRVGWVWRGELNAEGEDDFFGEVGTTINSYGWGIQVRWRSPLLRLGPFKDRSHFLLDYRFGSVPDVDLRDQDLQYQQLSVGVDVELLKRRQGFSPVPYVFGALGWRREEIRDDGDHPVFPEQHGTSAVAHYGAGVRFYFGHRNRRRPRYAIVLAANSWSPFSGAEASRGALRLRYLRPETTLGLRLTVQPRW